jgi:S1-C subfamily serine protease
MFRGMAVDEISPLLKKRFRIKENTGAIVSYVEDGSPADKGGINVADVITKVNGKEVKNKEDFISIVSKAKGSWLVATNRGFFVVKEK